MEREVQLGVNSEELKEDVVDVPDQVILVDLALRHLQLPSVHELHSPLQSKSHAFPFTFTLRSQIIWQLYIKIQNKRKTHFEVEEANRWKVDLEGVSSAPCIAQDAFQELRREDRDQ